MFVFNIISRMNIIPGYDFSILSRTQNFAFWFAWFNGMLCSLQNRFCYIPHIVFNARDYLGWQLISANPYMAGEKDMLTIKQKIYFNAKSIFYVFGDLANTFGDNFIKLLDKKLPTLSRSLPNFLPADNITNYQFMLQTFAKVCSNINNFLNEIRQIVDLKRFIGGITLIVIFFTLVFLLSCASTYNQINYSLTDSLNYEFSITNFVADLTAYIFFYPLHVLCYVFFAMIPVYNFFVGQNFVLSYNKLFSLSAILESIKGVNSDIFLKKMFDAYHSGAMSGHLFPKFATLLATFLIYIDGLLFNFSVTRYLFFDSYNNQKERIIGVFYLVLTILDFLVLWFVSNVLYYNCMYLPMLKICIKNRASPQAFLFLIGAVLTLVASIMIVLWFFGYIKL